MSARAAEAAMRGYAETWRTAKDFLSRAGALPVPAITVSRGGERDPVIVFRDKELAPIDGYDPDDASDRMSDIVVRTADGRWFRVVPYMDGHDVKERAEEFRELGILAIGLYLPAYGTIGMSDAMMAGLFSSAVWAWHPMLDAWDAADYHERVATMLDPVGRLLYRPACPVCGGWMYLTRAGSAFALDSFWCGECGREWELDRDRAKFVRTGDLEPSCPDCGMKMVLRHGPRGRFWGCGAYPNCRRTVAAVAGDF